MIPTAAGLKHLQECELLANTFLGWKEDLVKEPSLSGPLFSLEGSVQEKPTGMEVASLIYTLLLAELMLRENCKPHILHADLQAFSKNASNVLKLTKSQIKPDIIAKFEKFQRDSLFRVACFLQF